MTQSQMMLLNQDIERASDLIGLAIAHLEASQSDIGPLIALRNAAAILERAAEQTS